jgi:phage gpG-like protein
MAGAFEVRVSTKGLEAVAAALNHAADALADTRPLLYKIKDYGIRAHKDRFASGISPDGAAWAPNAESTISIKGSSSPLVQSGALSGSITGYIRAPRTVVIGTSDPKGAQQQAGYIVAPGARFAGAMVPARPFMGWSKQDVSIIRAMCIAFVRSSVR